LAHEGGKVVCPMHRPPLTLKKYSWYSFLLDTESTSGPCCGRKDYVNEKFQWHHRESNNVRYTIKSKCICWSSIHFTCLLLSQKQGYST